MIKPASSAAKKTNFYRVFSLSVLSALSFVCMGIYLKETMQYALFYREQQQLFLSDFTYFIDLLKQPGGCSMWIARWMVHFFHSLWAGVVLTTLLFTFIFATIVGLFRKIEKPYGFYPLCVLPVLCMAVSLQDACFYYEGVVAFGITTCFLLLYSLFSFQNSGYRIFTACLLTALLFWMAGAVALLFAVCALLWDLSARRRFAWATLSAVVTALLAGFGMVQTGMTGIYSYVYTPAGYYDITVSLPAIHYASWMALLFLLLSARPLKRLLPEKRWIQAITGGCFFVAGCAAFLHLYRDAIHPALHTFYKYEYYTVKGMWAQLAEISGKEIHNYNDANYLHMALAEQSILTERLFHYPQFGPQALIYLPKDKSSDVRLAHLLFSMGNMAAAQNVAFNASMTHGGYNPTMLKMLLQIELMRGAYPVALKYIELLEKSPHYAEWAASQRVFLSDDAAVAADPVLGRGRRSFPIREAFVLDSPMDDLYRIVEASPADEKAIQYALSFLLLAKDFNHVQAFIDAYYGTPNLQTLPVPAQEALLFYADYYHTLTTDYAREHGISEEELAARRSVDMAYCRQHGVTEETFERFARFKEAYEQVRRTGSEQGLHAHTRTFWYYLLFTRIS